MAQLLRPISDITRNATLSGVVTITPTAGALVFQIQPLTQDIYLTLRGETPSSTSGYKLTAGAIFQIDVSSDTVIKVIEAAASAEIRYQSFVYQTV